MVTLNEKGASTGLLISLVFVTLLFLGAVGAAVWAYGGRQDYKNNADQKIQAAVDKALKAEDSKKDAQFAEDSKKPLKPYSGPTAFGSIKLNYPKTWSAYVIENDTGNPNLDGYFYPDVVPGVNDLANAYALRMQVVGQSYSTLLGQYDSFVKAKTVTVTPYSLPSVKGIVGVRIDGAITSSKNGSMILLPLRDKTLKVWTEASQFTNDFNNNILPNLSFSP